MHQHRDPTPRRAMRRGRLVVALFAAAVAGLAASTPAGAHSSGCHAAHSCPSDHHSYPWPDRDGRLLDCAEPGASEVSPADTIRVAWDGRQYLCHVAGRRAHRTTTTPHGLPIRPDRRLTPGAVLTTSVSAICTPGYSARVRNVSARARAAAFVPYRITPVPYAFEVDHLISLELGGSNSLANLWPEAYAGPWGARVKDRLENRLHSLVCAGQLPLRTAQRLEAGDWIAAYKRFVG